MYYFNFTITLWTITESLSYLSNFNKVGNFLSRGIKIFFFEKLFSHLILALHRCYKKKKKKKEKKIIVRLPHHFNPTEISTTRHYIFINKWNGL